jgi:hypothetical protein
MREIKKKKESRVRCVFQREVCVKDMLVILFDIRNKVSKMAFMYIFNSARRHKVQFKTNFIKLHEDLTPQDRKFCSLP